MKIRMGGGKAVAWIRFVAVLAAATGLHAASLSAAPPDAVTADQRALTASVQELLSALGYDGGPADGLVGQRTRQAILAFQRRAGMKADGQPSEMLYRRLTLALNRGISPSAAGPEAAAPAPASAPAQAPVPSPSPVAARTNAAPSILSGPRWRITDGPSGASIDLVFEPVGRVGGVATARFWRWEQDGATVRLFYDDGWGGRVVRSGTLARDRIVGTAEGIGGKRWPWRAERIADGSGAEAAAWTASGR